MFFFPRSGRLELLRTAHAGEFDRPKTGNYDSDRQVTDCGRLDTKPAFLIGGRLIGASLVNRSHHTKGEEQAGNVCITQNSNKT